MTAKRAQHVFFIQMRLGGAFTSDLSFCCDWAEASFQPWQRDSPLNRSGPTLQSPRRASPPMVSPRFQGHAMAGDQALA